MTPEAFDAALRARGIELTLRRNTLHVWPGRAYRLGLSHADRDYIAAHREALKAVVRAGRPPTTVQWRPPDAATSAPRDAALADRLSRDAALRAEHLEAWLVLHGNEAEASTIRHQQATAEMRAAMRRRAMEGR